jgi:hypothetical protein
MNVRGNICCLVAAGKHVNNIGTFVKQLLIITIEKLLEAIFSVASAWMPYIQDPVP